MDIGKSDITDLSSGVKNYSVSAKPLEFAGSGEEYTYVDFSNAAELFGFYKQIPELKKAIDALATWTCGKGWTTPLTSRHKVILESIQGWGEDSIDSIFENMIIVKKVIGNSFAEIIRAENNQLINLKPISPERMRIAVDKKGLIVHYEYLNGKDNWTKLDKKKVLHLCNDRVGDEVKGVSVVEACRWIIEARNEAMDTYRKILKRSLALGVLYIDTDDKTKIDAIKAKYKDAVNKGEVLVLPKDTAELKDSNVSVKDFLSWIGYLENFFYQAVGIPKIILGGSQEFTEASSKVGYLTFEQVYMAEQRKLEQDIWSQLGIKIKFERPVSLKEDMVQSEAANTGQVGFQPKESSINTQRE